MIKIGFNGNIFQDDQALGPSVSYAEFLRGFSTLNDSELEFIPHNFSKFISNPEKEIEKLKDINVIVTTVGTFSWYYFYLREKFNLSYKIIRDSRTCLYSPELLNESLCAPFVQACDKFLFSSIYQKKLLQKIFPTHLNDDNSFVCYPFFESNFPKVEKKEHNEFTFGYFGRISMGKGANIILDAFEKVYNEEKRAKLILAGSSDPNFSSEKIYSQFEKKGIKKEALDFIGKGKSISHKEVFEQYSKISTLLLPTLWGGDSFGRPIVEAAYCNIPIIANDLGASSCLLPPENLVSVQYKKEPIDLHYLSPMANCDTNSWAEKMLSFKNLKKSDSHKNYLESDEIFLNVLKNGKSKDIQTSLSNSTKKFIEKTEIFFYPGLNSYDELLKNSLIFMNKFVPFENSIKINTSWVIDLNFKPFLFIRE